MSNKQIPGPLKCDDCEVVRLAVLSHLERSFRTSSFDYLLEKHDAKCSADCPRCKGLRKLVKSALKSTTEVFPIQIAEKQYAQLDNCSHCNSLLIRKDLLAVCIGV